MRAALVLALMLLPAAATAQALKSIDDCERFSEPLAYNACLAKFGPERGAGPQVSSEVSGEPGEEPTADEPKTARGKGSRRGYSRGSKSSSYYRRNRHGRVSATFDVSPYFSNSRSSRKRRSR